MKLRELYKNLIIFPIINSKNEIIFIKDNKINQTFFFEFNIIINDSFLLKYNMVTLFR